MPMTMDRELLRGALVLYRRLHPHASRREMFLWIRPIIAGLDSVGVKVDEDELLRMDEAARDRTATRSPSIENVGDFGLGAAAKRQREAVAKARPAGSPGSFENPVVLSTPRSWFAEEEEAGSRRSKKTTHATQKG